MTLWNKAFSHHRFWQVIDGPWKHHAFNFLGT